jgi:prepilin-type N-terminal cleavage/methylation domain-containing protein
MTLSNIKKMKDERGFTIVELLIVIVVIAILAAIVIVAYNGIQNRARDTQNKTDASSIVKVAEAVNADSGAYPTGTTDATLTTSFNSVSTAKLPSGVAVKYLAAAGTAPSYATALADADNTTARTYTVKVCASPNGLVIYYPQRSDSTVKTINAGPGC